MPFCGCSASATPRTCAVRLWKTLSSPAPRVAAGRGWPRLTSCWTTPTAPCRWTTTRWPSLGACTATARASTSSTAPWPGAWTCWTSCTIRVWAPAPTPSSPRGRWIPSSRASRKTAARSSRRPPACSSTSSARPKASASWPIWTSISCEPAMWRGRWPGSWGLWSARRRRPAPTRSWRCSRPICRCASPWTTCGSSRASGMPPRLARRSWRRRWKSAEEPSRRLRPRWRPCRSVCARRPWTPEICRGATGRRLRLWSASIPLP